LSYRILADSVLLFHFAFVVFVVVGGFLVLRWRSALWLHPPAALWGVLIQFGGWTCPLTPLENHLRALGGQAGYSGGFVEHYLFSVLYPAGLTRGVQLVLGLGVLVLNLWVYHHLFRRMRRIGTSTAADTGEPVSGAGPGPLTASRAQPPPAAETTHRPGDHPRVRPSLGEPDRAGARTVVPVPPVR
jgi:hypothetical protein